ncbi:hypothetical protein AAKU67_004310 [Oxalobacteraceae bacterium GrIS 2.11]
MSHCQITCITKPDVHSQHEHITHVGNPAWSMKRLTVEQVINNIRSGTDTFFVLDRFGNKADVAVVDATSTKRAYIRTHADGKWTDNLLALNQCSL